MFGTKIATRKQAELTKIGNRYVSDDLRWHNDLMAKLLIQRSRDAPDKWTQIEELARTAFGINNEKSREKARKKIAPLMSYLIDEYDLLLVSEDDFKPGTRIKRRWRVKILNPNSMADRSLAASWIAKMRLTNELRADKEQKAFAIATRDAPTLVQGDLIDE